MGLYRNFPKRGKIDQKALTSLRSHKYISVVRLLWKIMDVGHLIMHTCTIYMQHTNFEKGGGGVGGQL